MDQISFRDEPGFGPELVGPFATLSGLFFKIKGGFTQYPFFVRFRPFFYVFASP